MSKADIVQLTVQCVSTSLLVLSELNISLQVESKLVHDVGQRKPLPFYTLLRWLCCLLLCWLLWWMGSRPTIVHDSLNATINKRPLTWLEGRRAHFNACSLDHFHKQWGERKADVVLPNCIHNGKLDDPSQIDRKVSLDGIKKDSTIAGNLYQMSNRDEWAIEMNFVHLDFVGLVAEFVRDLCGLFLRLLVIDWCACQKWVIGHS